MTQYEPSKKNILKMKKTLYYHTSDISPYYAVIIAKTGLIMDIVSSKSRANELAKNYCGCKVIKITSNKEMMNLSSSDIYR